MIKPEKISLKAYAKINLSLDITGRREDGYHFVEMIMHQIDLYDEVDISVSPLKEGDEKEISLICDNKSVPEDESNLAVRAARLIFDMFPNDLKTEIFIKKNIPVAAGLAGGSADAAAVILGLNHIMGLGMDLKAMTDAGLKLGADVPFCITGQAKLNDHLNIEGGSCCALSQGIGEILTPMCPIDAAVLLTKPPIEVSTAGVYREYDAIENEYHPPTKEIITAVNENNIKLLTEKMGNVLEKVTLTKYPIVELALKQMESAGKRRCRMSGSGPSLFMLFEDPRDAVPAYETMKNVFKETYLIRTCVK